MQEMLAIVTMELASLPFVKLHVLDAMNRDVPSIRICLPANANNYVAQRHFRASTYKLSFAYFTSNFDGRANFNNVIVCCALSCFERSNFVHCRVSTKNICQLNNHDRKHQGNNNNYIHRIVTEVNNINSIL
jgi:hypothetical protein